MRDAILNRKSTRTFNDQELTKKEIDLIIELVKKHEGFKGPFGHKFELTFNLNNKRSTNGKKIGTYGLLKNVQTFIGGVCENSQESIIDFGFVFEHLILDLTKNNFDTCWLGGTFKRKDYRRKLQENELIPAISPVGFAADKRSFIDRTIRKAAQSKNRLDDSVLFFDYDTLGDVKDKTDIVIKQSLCLVKRAPSASNKQPWRLYVDGNIVHFYIQRTPNYAKMINYDIQSLDIGIALIHYDIGVRYFNKELEYKVIENPKVLANQDYIISVEIK